MQASLDEGTRATILIHTYRAMVGRADIWRMRMDTTTNWSIGTTAAVASFALGNAEVPHYVVHIASFLTVIFLLLESRRLTFYHLWQQRVLLLERSLIASAVSSAPPSPEAFRALEQQLGPQLGTTVPSMSRTKAAARRLRRVYVYLFAAQLLAWILKLASQPTQTASLSEIVARAHVGSLPGAVLFVASGAAFAAAVVLAVAKGGVSRQGEAADEPA